MVVVLFANRSVVCTIRRHCVCCCWMGCESRANVYLIASKWRMRVPQLSCGRTTLALILSPSVVLALYVCQNKTVSIFWLAHFTHLLWFRCVFRNTHSTTGWTGEMMLFTSFIHLDSQLYRTLQVIWMDEYSLTGDRRQQWLRRHWHRFRIKQTMSTKGKTTMITAKYCDFSRWKFQIFFLRKRTTQILIEVSVSTVWLVVLCTKITLNNLRNVSVQLKFIKFIKFCVSLGISLFSFLHAFHRFCCCSCRCLVQLSELLWCYCFISYVCSNNFPNMCTKHMFQI